MFIVQNVIPFIYDVIHLSLDAANLPVFPARWRQAPPASHVPNRVRVSVGVSRSDGVVQSVADKADIGGPDVVTDICRCYLLASY